MTFRTAASPFAELSKVFGRSSCGFCSGVCSSGSITGLQRSCLMRSGSLVASSSCPLVSTNAQRRRTGRLWTPARTTVLAMARSRRRAHMCAISSRSLEPSNLRERNTAPAVSKFSRLPSAPATSPPRWQSRMAVWETLRAPSSQTCSASANLTATASICCSQRPSVAKEAWLRRKPSSCVCKFRNFRASLEISSTMSRLQRPALHSSS
mmetsp:Transcript_27856/g.64940  ORF Transcript_27856/g.64940 Transcript_27856/m.64940 type:complete len:209 (-) Transcript_27856:242-868(-)